MDDFDDDYYDDPTPWTLERVPVVVQTHAAWRHLPGDAARLRSIAVRVHDLVGIGGNSHPATLLDEDEREAVNGDDGTFWTTEEYAQAAPGGA